MLAGAEGGRSAGKLCGRGWEFEDSWLLCGSRVCLVLFGLKLIFFHDICKGEGAAKRHVEWEGCFI